MKLNIIRIPHPHTRAHTFLNKEEKWLHRVCIGLLCVSTDKGLDRHKVTENGNFINSLPTSHSPPKRSIRNGSCARPQFSETDSMINLKQ